MFIWVAHLAYDLLRLCCLDQNLACRLNRNHRSVIPRRFNLCYRAHCAESFCVVATENPHIVSFLKIESTYFGRKFFSDVLTVGVRHPCYDSARGRLRRIKVLNPRFVFRGDDLIGVGLIAFFIPCKPEF